MSVCKEDWQVGALYVIRRWARVNGDWSGAYTAEMIRAWASQNSPLIEPLDLRWWGPVVQRALREKIIRRKGFAPAKSSHGALKARYVGTRFA